MADRSTFEVHGEQTLHVRVVTVKISGTWGQGYGAAKSDRVGNLAARWADIALAGVPRRVVCGAVILYGAAPTCGACGATTTAMAGNQVDVPDSPRNARR